MYQATVIARVRLACLSGPGPRSRTGGRTTAPAPAIAPMTPPTTGARPGEGQPDQRVHQAVRGEVAGQGDGLELLAVRGLDADGAEGPGDPAAAEGVHPRRLRDDPPGGLMQGHHPRRPRRIRRAMTRKVLSDPADMVWARSSLRGGRGRDARGSLSRRCRGGNAPRARIGCSGRRNGRRAGWSIDSPPKSRKPSSPSSRPKIEEPGVEGFQLPRASRPGLRARRRTGGRRSAGRRRGRRRRCSRGSAGPSRRRSGRTVR